MLVIREVFTTLKMPHNLRPKNRFEELGKEKSQGKRAVVRGVRINSFFRNRLNQSRFP